MDKYCINELKNIFILFLRENGHAIPALPAPEPTVADSAITSSLPRELVDKFRECIKAYSAKFNKGDISASEMYRVLFFHFMDNWENMPMEKAWKTEKERPFVITRRGRGMRVTVSGI